MICDGFWARFKRDVFKHVLLMGLACCVIFPVALVLFNAFRPRDQIEASPICIPKQWNFSGIFAVADQVGFWRATLITALITTICVGIIVLGAAVLACAMTWSEKNFAIPLKALVVAGALIPVQAVVFPMVNIADSFALRNVVGLITVYSAFATSVSAIVYYVFVRSFPGELFDAALLDGAGPIRMIFRVVFPRLRVVTAGLAAINALYIWNDFLLPFLFLDRPQPTTLMMGFYDYGISEGLPWQDVLNQLIVAVVPGALVFLIAYWSIDVAYHRHMGGNDLKCQYENG